MYIITKVEKRENGSYKITSIGRSDRGRVYVGVSKQNPADVFDYTIGKELAIQRMKLKQLNAILKSKMKRYETLEELTKRNFKDIESLSAKIEEAEDTIADLEQGFTEIVFTPETDAE